MYNTRFTKKPLSDVSKIHRYRLVLDDNGNVILCLFKNKITDLNGEKIASFRSITIKKLDDKKLKSRQYAGQDGKFSLIEDTLLLNGVEVGKVQPLMNLRAIIIAIISLLLLSSIAFLLFSNPFLYKDAVPVVDIIKTGDNWTGDGTLIVFDNKIQPGSNGEFKFKINNPTENPLNYSFTIYQYYKDEPIKAFPMQYSLILSGTRVNQTNPLKENEALVIKNLNIESESKQSFKVEWTWPFEGDDSMDTFFGDDFGFYSLRIHIEAMSIIED